MTVYETIKSMSLNDMAAHHAIFAVITLKAFIEENNINYETDWIKMIEDFTEKQKELLQMEN